MKVINFTAVEILPALLDGSKTQTIRPAFSKHPCGGEKPARFKVGEKAVLMWNQRSQYSMFCSVCGKVFIEHSTCQNGYAFRKSIREVEITEVFKLRLNAEEAYGRGLPFYQELAKRDGFKDSTEMFKWIHENYDLSTEKVFWVYRWRNI